MLISTRARVQDARALAGAIALGSGAGLVIGAVYLAGAGLHGAPAPLSAPAASIVARAVPAPRSPPAASPAPVRVASRAPGLAAFLRDRLRLDGVALTQMAARPFHFAEVAAAQTDQHCLAEAVYFEARGESEDGQKAVAQVVLNRVRHPAFPKTVCGVVHQRVAAHCQFAFACGSELPATGSSAWRRAEEVSLAALHGSVMAAVGDATHFQNVRGGPFAGLMRVAQVGAHVFYRFGGHEGSAAMFHQAPTPSAAPPVSAPPAKVEDAKADARPASTPGRIEVVYAAARTAARRDLKPDALPIRIAAAQPSAPALKRDAAPERLAAPAPAPALKADAIPVRISAPADHALPAGSKPDAMPTRIVAKPAVTVALAS